MNSRLLNRIGRLYPLLSASCSRKTGTGGASGTPHIAN